MKKTALYILLFSYTMIMLKPVTPHFSDLAAHIFSYSQHMATVHFENGKLHVHKEITDNAKKTSTQKEIPSAKKENSGNDHLAFPQDNDLPEFKKTPEMKTFYSGFLHYNYLQGEFPPPRT
ncbi:MAG TPA: hypothetical protein VK489_00485 [Ferruginibacter sp.]|nr:hypothetical protein [Ferruginibacter sp.]